MMKKLYLRATYPSMIPVSNFETNLKISKKKKKNAMVKDIFYWRQLNEYDSYHLLLQAKQF